MCNKQWFGKTFAINLRPQASGNGIVADKPNDSVVTSNSAKEPIRMLLQKCIDLIMGCVLKTSE